MIFFYANGDVKIVEKFSENLVDSLYKTLQKNWINIFPDSNRNSGGVQFFNYIIKNMNPTKQEFDWYNKFYCGVSGSLISPERVSSASDFVLIRHINGGFVSGNYYRCCWPCSCDIMNPNLNIYAEDILLELKDGEYNYTVLTMNDPCLNSIKINNKEVLPDPKNTSNEWKQVSSFSCSNKKTDNAYKTKNGRLVFAVLFDPKKSTRDEYKSNIKFDNDLNDKCQKRIDPNNNLSNWGMGDIFISLTNSQL